MPRTLPSRDSLPPGQLPQPEHSMTAHGVKNPVLFGLFGSAHPADIGIDCPGRWLSPHSWRYLKNV